MLYTDGTIRFYTMDGSDALDFQFTSSPYYSNGAQTSFTQIGAVFTSGASPSVALYGNGAVLASQTDAGGVINAALNDSYAPFTIGVRGDGTANNRFNGKIASVMVFNRALSAAEVKRIYNLQKNSVFFS